MANFNCPKCNKPIIEDEKGKYITGCEHYPIEVLYTYDDNKAVLEEIKEL